MCDATVILRRLDGELQSSPFSLSSYNYLSIIYYANRLARGAGFMPITLQNGIAYYAQYIHSRYIVHSKHKINTKLKVNESLK